MKEKVVLVAVFVGLILLLSGCYTGRDSFCPADYVVREEEGMLRCYQRVEHPDTPSCGLFDINSGCAWIEYIAKACPNACINSVEKEAEKK